MLEHLDWDTEAELPREFMGPGQMKNVGLIYIIDR